MTTATLPKMPPPLPTTTRRTGNGNEKKAANVPALGKLEPVFQPPRIILNAVEGWGKTTMGTYAPNPAILMATGETGYTTLLGAGLVPNVDAAHIATWEELLAMLDHVGGHDTVVLDALGGFERLCHVNVCDRDFNGDWGERGFASYKRGYEVAVNEWLKLLVKLDQLRSEGITILILSHCKIKTFKNPLGADYDRYVSDVHDKTWAATAKWGDAVLFGNFYSVVDTERGGKPEALKKGKGIGGTERIVYTERRDAFDAKNRYGMENEIDIPNDPSKSWNTIYTQIRKDK